MAEHSAGSAKLEVFPDASGFQKRLKADLEKVNLTIKVPVHPNLAQASADLDRWRQQQQRNAVDLKVNVDTTTVTAKVRAAKSELSGLQKALKDAGLGQNGIRPALLPNVAALGIGSLPALATGITAVASSIQQLAGAGAALPGALGGLAVTIGTVKVGMSGVADAFKAADKASDGTAKSIAAMDKALAGLAPSAAEAVKAGIEIKKQLTDALVKPTQQNLFDGLADSAHKLVNSDLPVVQRGMAATATAINGNLKQLFTSLGSDSSQSFLDKIFGNTADAETRAQKAIDPIVHAFGGLAATSSNVLPRLADGLTKVGTRFDNFITKNANNGNLDKWINSGIDGLDNLGNSAINIGKSFASITQAAGGGDGLTGTLDSLTGKLATFLASDKGQADLKNFFQEGKEQLEKWVPIIGNVIQSLPALLDGARQWTNTLLPPLKTITGVITEFPHLIQYAAEAFVAWKTIDGVTSLFNKLNNVGGSLETLPGKAEKSATGIKGAFSKLQLGNLLGAGTIAALTANQTSGMIGGANGAGSDLGGLGLNLAGGAAAGALVGGPTGAIVGAIAGLGTSIYQRVLADINTGRKQFEDQNSRNDANPDRPGNPQTARDVTGTNPVFQPSLSNPTINTALLPAIKAGQVKGFAVGADGQTIINTATGQPVDVPGLNLAPAPPAPPPPPKPAVQIPTSNGVPFPVAPPAAPTAPPTALNPNPAPSVSVPNPITAGTTIATKVDPAAQASVDNLAKSIQTLPTGEVKITDGSPAVLDSVKKLDTTVTELKDHPGEVIVKANTEEAQTKLDALIRNFQSRIITIQVQPQMGALPVAPGKKTGGVNGVLPGYSPGVDNMLVPMSGGEGVIVPQITRQLGPQGIAAINQGALTDGDFTLPGKPLPLDPGQQRPIEPGNFNPAMKIDTSTTSVAPPYDPNRLLFGDILHSIPGAYGPADTDPYHKYTRGTDGGLYGIGKGHATGGIVDKFGNPLNAGAAPGPGGFIPGAGPAPIAGNGVDSGGVGGIFGSILGGLGGPISNLTGLAGAAGGQSGTGFTSTGSFMDRLAGVPGLAGLIGSAGSSNPGAALDQWGGATGKWLGGFAAKTLGGFGSALWQGALGLVGLDNSILSPTNPYFQDIAKSAGAELGPDSLLGNLFGTSSSAGGKGATEKQIREGGQKVTRADQKVAGIVQRIKELKPTASQSQRASLRDQLLNAQQDAADARTDFSTLTGGADPASAQLAAQASLTDPNSTSHHGGPGQTLTPMSGGEGIIDPAIAAQLGPDGIAALNAGKMPIKKKGFAGGGINIPTGVVLPPPNLQAAKAATAQIKATPKIQAPTASTKQAPGPQRSNAPAAPPAPAPGTPPPPVSAKPTDKPLDGSPTPVVGAAPTDYNHNLAAINTGIASGASAIGSAVSMALGIAGSSGFAPGAGAIGQIAAGAIQEGGKIVTDLVNVGSSFLVGSVPGNLGGDGPAQGSTLTAPQNVPQTAQDNSRNYNIQAGYQPSDLINALQLHDAQQSQAANAQYRG